MNTFTNKDIDEIHNNLKIMEDLFENFLIEKMEADLSDIADIKISVKKIDTHSIKLRFETIIQK